MSFKTWPRNHIPSFLECTIVYINHTYSMWEGTTWLHECMNFRRWGYRGPSWRLTTTEYSNSFGLLINLVLGVWLFFHKHSFISLFCACLNNPLFPNPSTFKLAFISQSSAVLPFPSFLPHEFNKYLLTENCVSVTVFFHTSEQITPFTGFTFYSSCF